MVLPLRIFHRSSISIRRELFQQYHIFLSRLNQLRDIPDNTLLAMSDVVRLYLYMPHEEVLET